MPSSRCMDASVRWRRAEAMARAWSTPMAPSRQASAHSGRWRGAAARDAPGAPGGDARGSRQRVASQAEAVLAPWAPPLLPRLEGRRRLCDEGLEAATGGGAAPDGGAVAVVLRTRHHERLERLGEVVQLHGSMKARGCDDCDDDRMRFPGPSSATRTMFCFRFREDPASDHRIWVDGLTSQQTTRRTLSFGPWP